MRHLHVRAHNLAIESRAFFVAPSTREQKRHLGSFELESRVLTLWQMQVITQGHGSAPVQAHVHVQRVCKGPPVSDKQVPDLPLRRRVTPPDQDFPRSVASTRLIDRVHPGTGTQPKQVETRVTTVSARVLAFPGDVKAGFEV
jgi:hypothetical protein